ncbi:alpha-L-rhamnosidase [Filimonas lacunae]|uniref:alpha-L-rhamnosidase n=1 Tax=Filimonas lacunae TaxID=477680 RepID=A0A173M9D7_9BACT|nr:family 78 glycoside hydrolase catalytic domain [Filimonas lacunae]BAV04088.1 alpha-L-rhamnosidase [Filimonas lacunae]SIT15581.1 alpha-L-rhamnosidase [Filimonas lacunae]
MSKANPVGIGKHPYFGWLVNDNDANEKQTAYEIIVATTAARLAKGDADCWSSGRVTSSQQNYVFFTGSPLQAFTRYYWKVRTWDKDGNVSAYSDMQQFDTGPFADADWQGSKWISRTTSDKDDYTYFRKAITTADKPIAKAIVYMSAAHSYELYINGKQLAKGSVHHYPQYQYYHAYDVSNDITKGKVQQLAVLTHWYGGGQGRAVNKRGLLLKLVIDYADGTQAVVGSDGSWKQHQAEQFITGLKSRNGEGVGFIDKMDARKMISNWSGVGYNDSDWQAAVEEGAPPVAPWVNPLQSDLARLIEKEITPKSITRLKNGSYIIDLGKIYAGVPRIRFANGKAGDTVVMRGGFVLNEDGAVSATLDQNTNLEYSFVLNGKEAVFQPMVYLGIRYLQVSSSPVPLTTENVQFVTRHYELDPTQSEFYSSDDMLNLVWELMKHSLLVGAQEGFVDTPTREKGTFLGDGWSEAVPAMSVTYDRVMSDRVLKEFLQSQDQYWPDGRLNSVYPNVDGKRDIPDYTQAFLVWVWDYYMQTGNTDFLQENYTRLVKVAEYVASCRDAQTGLITRLAGGSGPYLYGIVDWPQVMRYGYDMNAEARTVMNAYAYTDFTIISHIAGVLGKATDVAAYAAKAADIKTAMNTLLLNKEGVYHDGLLAGGQPSSHVSQHANIFPYAMGIVPDAQKESVASEIVRQKMSVGMVCLRYLPEAVGLADKGEHLINLYTNTEWDGWAKNIKQGATVTWEAWDADVRNESMCHPWGAVGLLAMQQYMLGVTAAKPQYEEVQVKPLDFGNRLQKAQGKIPTDRGVIQIAWQRKEHVYDMQLTLPVNMSGAVFVPAGAGSDNLVEVNGKKVQGERQGRYIRLANIGSGTYQFKRVL